MCASVGENQKGGTRALTFSLCVWDEIVLFASYYCFRNLHSTKIAREVPESYSAVYDILRVHLHLMRAGCVPNNRRANSVVSVIATNGSVLNETTTLLTCSGVARALDGHIYLVRLDRATTQADSPRHKRLVKHVHLRRRR